MHRLVALGRSFGTQFVPLLGFGDGAHADIRHSHELMTAIRTSINSHGSSNGVASVNASASVGSTILGNAHVMDSVSLQVAKLHADQSFRVGRAPDTSSAMSRFRSDQSSEGSVNEIWDHESQVHGTLSKSYFKRRREALQAYNLALTVNRGVMRTRILSTVLCCFAAPAFMNSIGNFERSLFSGVALSLAGGCVGFSMLLARLGNKAASWYNGIVFIIGLGSLILSGLAQVHLAHVVDQDALEFSHILDSLSVIMLCGALDVASIATQMSYFYTVVLVHVSFPINCIWVFALAKEVSDDRAKLYSLIVLNGQLYVIGIYFCIRRWLAERVVVRRFAEDYFETMAWVNEQRYRLEMRRELLLDGEEAIKLCKSNKSKSLLTQNSLLSLGRRSQETRKQKHGLRDGDIVVIHKKGPYEGKRAVMLKDEPEKGPCRVHLEEDHDAKHSKWLSSKYLEKVAPMPKTEYKTGDQVRITEFDTLTGRTAVVMDPCWHGLVKVSLDNEDELYRAKCVPQRALEMVPDESFKDEVDLVPVAGSVRSVSTAPLVSTHIDFQSGKSVDTIDSNRSGFYEWGKHQVKNTWSLRHQIGPALVSILRLSSPSSDPAQHRRSDYRSSDSSESIGRKSTFFESLLPDDQATGQEKAQPDAPNKLLAEKLHGMEVTSDKVYEISKRIRDPSYSLREYFDDCCEAFPELYLFTDSGSGTQSGRDAEAEYQRTMGALFAVYWLFRADDLDGRMGFCYGVDDNWETMWLQDAQSLPGSPRTRKGLKQLMRQGSASSLTDPGKKDSQSKTSGITGAISSSSIYSDRNEHLAKKLMKKPFSKLNADEKRFCFLHNMDWSMMGQLVSQSGCGKEAPALVERTAAILTLTAFHDIMKLEDLLPTVQAQHAPYRGYGEGTTIHDHDVALSYILEHYPNLLPSFTVLPPHQQQAIIFTQSKLGFNHGWFVQAEAPPGAMLTKFKHAMQDETASADIALYFLHWLTDLAGAEATPMNGAEKFVLKFPHAVLSSFLWSIPYLELLRGKSETEVVELYLQARWRVISPGSPIPQSKDAIACMRLAVMAQGDTMVVQAFYELSLADQKFLAKQMSHSGCPDQSFSVQPTNVKGPALLVYYGPALLQRNVGNLADMRLAVQILCKVYRGARKLWPASKEMCGTTVQVQIAALKEVPTKEIVAPRTDGYTRIFALVRQNDREGAIEEKRPPQINKLIEDDVKFHVCDFEVHDEEDEYDEVYPDSDDSDSLLCDERVILESEDWDTYESEKPHPSSRGGSVLSV